MLFEQRQGTPPTYFSLYLSCPDTATSLSMSLNSSISGVSSPILFSSSTASATIFPVDMTCPKRPRVTLAKTGNLSLRTHLKSEVLASTVGSVGPDASGPAGGGPVVSSSDGESDIASGSSPDFRDSRDAISSHSEIGGEKKVALSPDSLCERSGGRAFKLEGGVVLEDPDDLILFFSRYLDFFFNGNKTPLC